MKNRITSILLAVMLALSVGLAGCGGEQVPEITEHTLTISSTEGGEVTGPGEGTFSYDEVTVISLVAEPDEGYQFVSWTGNVSTIGNVNAAVTIMTTNSDYEITANFAIEILEIRDWYDLDAIRNNLDENYRLMNDLDCNAPGYDELTGEAADQGKGWEPIGSLHDPFIGSFDGQTHEIRDLLIRRSAGDWVGLFGCVGRGGVVQNLSLVNLDVVGGFCVGGVAGQIRGGTIHGCQSMGTVAGDSCVGGLVGVGGAGGAIWDTYSACHVSGKLCVGGLLGDNYRCTVSDSYSSGNVSGEDRLGGLVGDNICGTVSCSYSTGTVTGEIEVGGLVGYNYFASVVTNCYATGSVAGNQFVGGLVGYNVGGGIIADCYSVGGVTGDNSVGGLVGLSDLSDATASFWDAEASGCAESAGGTAKGSSEMQGILTFSRLSWDIVAVAHGETNDDYTWNIVDGQTYPFLSWQY